MVVYVLLNLHVPQVLPLASPNRLFWYQVKTYILTVFNFQSEVHEDIFEYWYDTSVYESTLTAAGRHRSKMTVELKTTDE